MSRASSLQVPTLDGFQTVLRGTDFSMRTGSILPATKIPKHNNQIDRVRGRFLCAAQVFQILSQKFNLFSMA